MTMSSGFFCVLEKKETMLALCFFHLSSRQQRRGRSLHGGNTSLGGGEVGDDGTESLSGHFDGVLGGWM